MDIKIYAQIYDPSWELVYNVCRIPIYKKKGRIEYQKVKKLKNTKSRKLKKKLNIFQVSDRH